MSDLNQRERDLLRQMREYLFDENLISEEEYASLAAEKGGVARLEEYDCLRAENTRLRSDLASSQARECAARAALTFMKNDRPKEGRSTWQEILAEDTVGDAAGKAYELRCHEIADMADAALASPAPPCPHQQRAEEFAAALDNLCQIFDDDEEGPKDPLRKKIAELLHAIRAESGCCSILSARDADSRRCGYRAGIMDAANLADKMLALEVGQALRGMIGDGVDEMAARDARMRAEGAAEELERIILAYGKTSEDMVRCKYLKARADELRKERP